MPKCVRQWNSAVQAQAALGSSSLYLSDRLLAASSFFSPLVEPQEVESALQDWSSVCVALEVLSLHSAVLIIVRSLQHDIYSL